MFTDKMNEDTYTMHTQTHTYTCKQRYMHTHIYTCTSSYMPVHIYIYAQVHVHKHVHTVTPLQNWTYLEIVTESLEL